MRKIYVTASLLLMAVWASPAAHAQADFRPGYIVRAPADTVRGEVDYRDARFNARQCRFRDSPQAAATTFQPAELLAYGLSDGYKIYRTLLVPGAAGEAASPAFLEVLVNGPASLYMFRDADRADHYYVSTSTFPLTELVQRKVMLEGQRILQTQNRYRNTLAQALPGCPSAQALLPALLFTPRDLGRAVETYNNCQLPPSVQARPAATVTTTRRRQPVRFGLVLGAERSATHFKGSANTYGLPVDFSLGPAGAAVGGLALNVPLTALSTKLSLEVELLYESQQYRQAYNGGPSGYYTYHFEMAYAKLPVLVRYTFPKGRVRPLLEAGPTVGYAVKMTTETYFTDNTGINNPPVEFFAKNHQQLQESLMAGAGVQFEYWQGRQATLVARYERDTGWGEATDFKTYSTHLYALLTLDLFK